MVRHLLGLLAGVAVTPLLWVGVAWAGDQIARHAAGQESSVPLPTACAVLMGVGLLGAVLAATRFSPLAAFVSGGVLLGGPLWALLDPGSLTQLLPAGLGGSDSRVHPLGPGLPLLCTLGTLLFLSALVPSRWRSRSQPWSEEVYPPLPPPARERGPTPTPPPPADPPPASDQADDLATRTTLPFRRGEDGIHPLAGDDDHHTRVFGDGR
ncbi:MAG: hypothetical protein PUE00_08555 [Thermobifida fusca]|nr:hypothetical protein [Thermobifida fusca]